MAKALQDLTPAGEILIYKYPNSLRRRFEKLRRFPGNFLVIGDAVCSFNPVYGQGMTSAALQTYALDQMLRKNSVAPDPLKYFRAAARYVDRAWDSSAVADYQYPTTRGNSTFIDRIICSYTKAVLKASHHDARVYDAFLQVTNLMKSPTSLFAPSVLWGTFWAATKRKLSGATGHRDPGGTATILSD